MNGFILAYKYKKSGSSEGSGSGSGSVSDLVALGILKKPVSAYENAYISNEEYSKVLIPYNDKSGKILLNNGCIEFEVVGVNHHKDANNADTPTITLMAKNVLRNAAFDAGEPSNTENPDRVQYGNNRWKCSNIRQWLNSSGEAGKWWTANYENNKYDAAPTSDKVSGADGAYANAPGFLAGFSNDVLQHFTVITNITAVPDADGGNSETTEDKVFLPSWTEMGFGDNNGIIEGTALSKFTDNNSRKKNNNYWMRSPFPSASVPVSCVNTNGSGDDLYPVYNTEVRYRTYYSTSLI